MREREDFKHCRQILDSTCGHPARCNDKTLILYHPFAGDLHASKIIQDVEFDLFKEDSDANITS